MEPSFVLMGDTLFIYFNWNNACRVATADATKENWPATLKIHGDGSPAALKTVQHRLIASGRIDYFNSADHDTTLTNVAAGRGVCLVPGFLNDHSGQFAWIPFDCAESFSCVLCTHKDDKRPALRAFLHILRNLYAQAVAFPL